MSPTSNKFMRLKLNLNKFNKIGHPHLEFINGYIDVADGCWRQNVLVTSFRCWGPIHYVDDRFNTLRKSPT